MKRLLILCAVLLCINPASLLAFRQPDLAPLPNFDKRLGNVPAQPLPAEKQAATTRLKENLPGVKISNDRLLQSPSFISHPNGFLSAPAGQGGRGLSAQALQSIPADDPHRPIKAFLNEHSALFGYDSQILKTARIKKDFTTDHSGLRTAQWAQEVDGIPVFEATLLAHITKNGELVNVSTRLLPNPARAAAGKPAAPAISAARAVVLAAKQLGDELSENLLTSASPQPIGPEKKQRFNGNTILKGESTAELVWLPLNNSTLTLCWRVILQSRTRDEMFSVLVDAASGEVWLRRCLTTYISNASYRVWTSDSPSPFSPGLATPGTNQPPLVARTLVVTNAFDITASPNGWINDGDNETRGNNVRAYTDWPNTNGPASWVTGNPNRVFDFPSDLTQNPTNSSSAAVVQLFYLCNVYHDRLYQLGFTEAAGNFQVTNFGRGGLEGDQVEAQAQDGGGFNNANMATPPDGNSPRMQMYLFNGPTPWRDGSYDAEIVYHEHTHGLSWRLVGGGDAMYNEQCGGMGEGWSDWYALSLLSEPGDNVNGNYACAGYATFNFYGLFENYYYGIRRYPYSTDMTKNPLTFKDIDPNQADPHIGVPLSPIFSPWSSVDANEVHNAGEVWCITLWEARANLITKWGYATGNTLMMQLVTDGMKLSPPEPNFLQARDAIIQADLINTGGANLDELWRAFAKRGMGGSATSPGSESCIGVQEAFDLPTLAFKQAWSVDLFTGNGNGVIDIDECNEIYVSLLNYTRSNAVGVHALLFSTNRGVVISQNDAPYPDMPSGDLATNLVPFRVYTTPNFVCGTPINFTMIVFSSVQSCTNYFTLQTGTPGTPRRFDNNAILNIPGPATKGVDSLINVSGIGSGLSAVTVSLHMTYPYDYLSALYLIAPDGTRVTLYDGWYDAWWYGGDFGNDCSPDSRRTTFDDKATDPIAYGSPPYVGSFKPHQSFKAFLGKSGAAINGVWTLRVVTLLAPDPAILSCWSLELSPTLCANGGGDCSTDLAISSSYAPPVTIVQSNVAFTVTVTNNGPNAARTVTMTETLPPTFVNVSATSTRGSCSVANNIVTCSLGNLSAGASANISILARPTEIGPFTAVASVVSSVPDLISGNNVSTVSGMVYPPMPIIVSGGTRLISETSVPANSGIDPGETVTIAFAFKNIGALRTSNLVATLLNSDGVTAASAPRSYGILIPGGSGATNSYTFTAAGTNGGPLTAKFQLQDGTNDLGFLSIPFRLVGAYSWFNPGVIQIRDTNKAGVYPSTINVSGLNGGIINKVTVTLSNITHSSAEDIDVLLVSPSGKSALLMSDAGYVYSLNGVTLTFDDTASSLPRYEQISSGTYAPTDYPRTDITNDDLFPEPAPAAPYGKNLSVFNGSDPNGVWSLFIIDDTYGGAGWINSGWQLNLYTIDYIDPTPDLGVTMTDSPDPILIGNQVTYSIRVTNQGPDTATGVLLSNRLPASLVVTSVVSSLGTITTNGNQILCSLGDMTNGTKAEITIIARAVASGTISNYARVFLNELDPNPYNNSASTLTTVSPTADLIVSMAASPAPATLGELVTFNVSVTNYGPSTASSLQLTNFLPASLTNISFVAPLGVNCTNNSNGIVSCSAATLLPNSGFTVNLRAYPSQVGLITNSSKLTAAQPLDLVSSNNFASLIMPVNNPSLILISDGAVLLTESGPLNGGVDSNETVTVNFALKNIGIASTTNLVATLQTSGGITPNTVSQSYGIVPPDGVRVYRSFGFKATGPNGTTVTASLRLMDGPTYLGVVTYPFILGGGSSFTNTTALTIPGSGPATVYPSRIVISNLAGVVNKATVSLRNLNHTYPADLDILLAAPNGKNVILMSDAVGGSPLLHADFTFDDNASASLPENSPVESGTYKPSNFGTALDFFPGPAPSGPYGANLAALNGVNPNGTWSLYIVDDSTSDLGSLDGGWTLTLSTVGRINYPSPRLSTPVRQNGKFTFIITGTPGATFGIETSTNLVTWINIGNVTLFQADSTFTDPTANPPQQRFYRVGEPTP